MIISRAFVCFCSSPSHARLSKKKSFFCSYFTCGTMYVVFCSSCLFLFIVMKFHLVAGAIIVSFFQKFSVMVLIKY